MYEGYNSMQLTYIAYFSAFMGCKYLIITNSSGGGVKGMKCGSLMVSKDHIAWASKCAIPAIYNDPRVGFRHPHSSAGHSKYLLELAKETA
jgi:purine nucleoside phosphorylase